MKPTRTFGIILCLALLALTLLSGPASAEEPDLSRMSDDEIVSLMNRVTDEMARRGIPKTAKLPQGAYIAGTDLPRGRYVYTCLAKGDDWGSVTVYADKGAGSQLLWDVVTAPKEGEDPETIYITLNEGDQLKSGVPFSLTIMPGVLFQ